MKTVSKYWNNGLGGKIVVIAFGLVIFVCLFSLFAPFIRGGIAISTATPGPAILNTHPAGKIAATPVDTPDDVTRTPGSTSTPLSKRVIVPIDTVTSESSPTLAATATDTPTVTPSATATQIEPTSTKTIATGTPIPVKPTVKVTIAPVIPTATIQAAPTVAPTPTTGPASATPVIPTPIPATPTMCVLVRVGATCKDGTKSTATGSGACSHHGGVASWTMACQ